MSFSSISSVSAASSDALLVRDVDGQHRPALAEEVRRVLANRVRRGATMSSPQAVKDHLRLEIGPLEHEVFCVLFLDAQHRIPSINAPVPLQPRLSAALSVPHGDRRMRGRHQLDSLAFSEGPTATNGSLGNWGRGWKTG